MADKKDMVNPEHYKQQVFETIDEMVIVFGARRVADYCRITAWKYRARAMFKGNFDLDMQKANWYLQKARELQIYVERSEVQQVSVTTLCVPVSKIQNR